MKSILFTLFLALLSLIEVLAIHREYYDTLGVQTSASQDEIKKAYKKLSIIYHPDRNPDDSEANNKFAKIANAYEVLSDPEKRRKYDQHGPDFEKQEQQANPWGDFFNPWGQQQERKGPELSIKIPVTLEDIYNGKEIEVTHTKQTICPHCRGSGADDPDHVKQCPSCNGQGFVIRRQQIAPGYYQQFQTHCDRCNGKGKIFTSTCHVCHGSKVTPGLDRFSLSIEKGIKHGQKINFQNMGNEFHDMASSDISFIIVETPHPIFTREGDNLRTIVDITLKEALLGFDKTLKHLDGHTVSLIKVGVTQPGEIERISGEGMPQHTYSSYHGDLYVEYRVRFPPVLSEEQKRLWNEFFMYK